MENKPKKTKSLSAKLKTMREDRDSWREYYFNATKDKRRLFNEIEQLKRLLSLKYYRIKYKIKAKDDLIYEYTQIIESYSAELAIEKLLMNKIHPTTFELLDITLMA